MADEDQPRSLTDDRPDLVVLIPEAAQPKAATPAAPPIVVPDRRDQWYERREAPWIIGAVVLTVLAVLLVAQDRTVAVSASPGTGVTATVEPTSPTWAALALPVPESFRTHTANVNGSLDVMGVANLGPGAAHVLTGSVVIADGPTVQQIFGEHAFSIVSPSGATLIAFLPYDAGDAPIGDPGQEVTFVGTLMPMPTDFAFMVGSEAASVGALTDVYVRVIPETLRIVTPIPEIS